MQSVAPSLGIELSPIGGRDAVEIERSITSFARIPSGSLIVTGSALAAVHHVLIVKLAAHHKLPAVYFQRFFLVAGGLLSYGPNYIDQHRLAAGYADRILRGERPADLPVQTPTKYELGINLKTANALGLTIAADAARPRRRGDRIGLLFAAVRWDDMSAVDGTFETSNDVRVSVAIRGIADIARVWRNRRN